MQIAVLIAYSIYHKVEETLETHWHGSRTHTVTVLHKLGWLCQVQSVSDRARFFFLAFMVSSICSLFSVRSLEVQSARCRTILRNMSVSRKSVVSLVPADTSLPTIDVPPFPHEGVVIGRNPENKVRIKAL